MRAEHLKGWIAASNRGKLAEEEGEEKTEAEEATWHTVVLVPKGKK